jgi:cytochrome b
MTNDASMNKSRKIKVWDAGVRLFHWIIVVLVALSYYSAEQDKFGVWADVHLWSGFGVITLVCWRIVWGFAGSDTARFSRFVRGPKAITAYLKGEKPKHAGHNPLGALAVVLMLLWLLAIAVLGLYSSDGMMFEGPLAGSNSEDMQELHEFLGELFYWMIALHIAVVIWYAAAKKMNLLLPMITGEKSRDQVVDEPRIGSPILAAVLLAIVVGAVYLGVFA